MINYTYAGAGGQEISAFKSIPENKPRAVVQIVHGVIEHAGRYAALAEFLNSHGYAVYANDHRGHGKTARTTDELGFFADNDGWNLCVEDLKSLQMQIKSDFPQVPLIMLGHSMGSFLVRTFLSSYGKELGGVVLSGTAAHPPALTISGRWLAGLISALRGKHYRSKLLASLSFGAYNKRIKNPHTPYDWVSRDQEIVRLYMEDPYCGFLCTTSLFSDLMKGLRFINRQSCYQACPQELPMLIFSGSEDPVGNYGQGPTRVASSYRESGLRDVRLKIYEGGRHEMLNETNKEEVWNDLLKWLDEISNLQLNLKEQ